MKFLSRLFNSNKVKCPRCLGKGDVNLEDLIRLKKESFWMPGKCAYCNGIGKVPSKGVPMISPDTAYLTTDLPESERKRLLNGDAKALARAKEHETEVNKLVEQIEHLYYIENQEAEEIADYLLRKFEVPNNSTNARQETVDYIKKVIESKLPKKSNLS